MLPRNGWGGGGITSASEEDTYKTGTAILKDNHACWSCLFQVLSMCIYTTQEFP